jgi:hypothetical protein
VKFDHDIEYDAGKTKIKNKDMDIKQLCTFHHQESNSKHNEQIQRSKGAAFITIIERST